MLQSKALAEEDGKDLGYHVCFRTGACVLCACKTVVIGVLRRQQAGDFCE